MATTKIWSVKNRLDHVLEYVSNEDKTIDKLGSYVSRNEATENQKYMTCVNCSGNDPFTSMMNLKDVFHDTSNIIAYHAKLLNCGYRITRFQPFGKGEN